MKKTFTLLVCLTFGVILKAQDSLWMSFFSHDIWAIENEADTLWIGTSYGLVKYIKPNETYELFTTENSGLPDNNIMYDALKIDSDGNKWIGTYGGIVKFDGNNWTIFDDSNSPLESTIITSIDIDINKNLWFGTASGLYKYNGTNWQVYNMYNSGLHSDYIGDLVCDGNFGIWVGTSLGLTFFNYHNYWQTYDVGNSGISDNDVLSVTLEDDKVWIGTYEGLCCYDKTNWFVYNTDNSMIPSNVIESVEVDENNVKWLATNEGLVRFDGNNWEIFELTNITYPTLFISVDIDVLGTVWAGTLAGGLLEYNGINQVEHFIGTSEFSEYEVTSIVQNQDGSIWMGGPRGVTHFYNGQWFLYNYDNTGTYVGSCRTLKFENNILWVGTDFFGLLSYDGLTWANYNTFNSSLPHNKIRDIEVDDSGVKWIATNAGVATFDGTNWIVYDTLNSGLPDDRIYEIEIDNNGLIWIGTRAGLVSFDGANWTIYNTLNSGLSSDFVYALEIDQMGNKWIGTASHGLNFFDGLNWVVYDSINSSAPNFRSINDIKIDQNNNKWLSCGQLIKFTGQSWEVFTPENSGIIDGNTSSLYVDSFNNKWIGLTNGLSIYNETGVILKTRQIQRDEAHYVLIVPNPAREYFTLKLPDEIKYDNLKIINLQGLTVYKSNLVSKDEKIKISGLSTGIYIVECYTNKGLYTGKMVVR